jgi:hypothetical protein
MAVIVWRHALLRHVRASYFLQNRSRSAGVGLSGQEQVVSPLSAFWIVRLELPAQFDGRLMKEFEGMVAAMEGKTNIAEFPICDPLRFGERVSPRQTPFDDGEWFTDGRGFVADGTHPTTLSEAAAKGARNVRVAMTEPVRPAFRVGDEFSYDYFLYRVTAADQAGNVSIAPRLRTDIPMGATLETDPAKVRMRFASDEEGQRMRDYLRWGAPIALNFVEAFDR